MDTVEKNKAMKKIDGEFTDLLSKLKLRNDEKNCKLSWCRSIAPIHGKPGIWDI